MHRMRNQVARMGLAAVALVAMASELSAELIRPRAGRAYPDIAADVHGVQTYTYDPATRTGEFQVTNTPYLMALGPSTASEVSIQPTTDGTREQILKLTLDPNGRLVDDPSNVYEVRGTVTLGGHTYEGLLLKGTPTSFGAKDADVFDLKLKITGGELRDVFGSDATLQVAPVGQSTFDGSFTKDFTGTEAQTNIRGHQSARAVTAAEPTTLLFLVVLGAGWYAHRRRQRRRARCAPVGPG